MERSSVFRHKKKQILFFLCFLRGTFHGTKRMRERILAIDLGTTTGWAARNVDGALSHGFVSFKVKAKDGAGMRYLRFRLWLEALPFEPQYVYYEQVMRHAGTQAAHVYGGLLAILSAYCEERHIQYQGVGVGTIKKHATGKGNASKHEIIKAAQNKGFAVSDDNEADALAILFFALEHHD